MNRLQNKIQVEETGCSIMSSQDSAIGILSPDNPGDKFEGINQSAQKVRKSHEPNALHSGFNRFKDPDM